MTSKLKQYLYLVFGIIVVASAAAFIAEWRYAFYCYAFGAVGFVVVRAISLSSSPDKRIRRLRGIQMMASLLLLGAGYLMYVDNNAWAIALFLAAAFDLIVSFRMPEEQS